MTLREIVDKIKSELQKDLPVYVDDTCIYVCGATTGVPDGLSGELKDAVSRNMYVVTTMPVDRLRKLGRYSYRMN